MTPIEKALSELPSGLHDASLETIELRDAGREFVLVASVDVGDPDGESEEARERRRRGRLVASGLQFFSVTPPTDFALSGRGESIDSGQGRTTSFPPSVKLANDVEPNLQWFYIERWNACVFVAAKEARWDWLE